MTRRAGGTPEGPGLGVRLRRAGAVRRVGLCGDTALVGRRRRVGENIAGLG